MKPRRGPIPFFTDNDVPDDVGEALEQAGHLVVRLREVMVTTSADPVIATACRRQGLVLVTHNVRHFRSISQAFESKRGRPESLSRVLLECSQVNAASRIRAAIELIEDEWERLGSTKAGLHISLGEKWMRTHR